MARERGSAGYDRVRLSHTRHSDPLSTRAQECNGRRLLFYLTSFLQYLRSADHQDGHRVDSSSRKDTRRPSYFI
eukprot:360771-Chlamydomonas_euryale.AAC.2